MEALFPEDPNTPSLAYSAHEKVPIRIPWVRKRVDLGTGFEVGALNVDPFRPNAFETSASNIQMTFLADSESSFRLVQSSKQSSSYEHLDFSGELSMGGSLLGASVRADYTRDVHANKDSNKLSLQASARIAFVKLVNEPTLTEFARKLAHYSPTKFLRTFGDYYVSGLYIGADSTSFFSSSSRSDLSTIVQNIEAEVTFLGFTETVYESHDNTRTQDERFDITFSGFDTLSGFSHTETARDAAGYRRVASTAAPNIAYGKQLNDRVRDALQAANVGETPTPDACQRLLDAGLIVELQLMPFAKLKDLVASLR